MTSKSGKTLAEKAQHLDPLKGIGGSEDQNDCDAESRFSATPGSAGSHDPGSSGACCSAMVESRDQADGGTPSENAASQYSRHANLFKLGADSIDLTDRSLESAYGFLSPSSPTSTSPETPTSPSPMKSSIRAKTPPGTPNRKSVRFADALGLDLETVKTILRNESPPDLHVHVDEERQTISAKVLSMCFQQPGGKPDFLPRLHKQNVCLENVVVHEFTLIGTIKVRNLGFEKAVRIRHSSDNWNSFVDVMAIYVQGSCDGPTDRFSFGLTGPKSMTPGKILSFSIYYKVAGQTFWDNNGGQNYSLICEEVKKT